MNAFLSLEYINKNLATITLSLVGFSLVIALVFLYGYLSPFDSNLIWLVEYSDIIKLLLLGIFFVATLFFTFGNMVNGWGEAIRHNKPRMMTFYIVLATSLLLYWIYRCFTDKEHLGFNVSLSFIWFFILYFLATKKWGGVMLKLGSVDAIWATAGLFSWFVIVLGLASGYYVKFYSADHRVVTTTDTYSEAKLVMMFTHHTVLYTNKKVVVVPTAEVKKIETQN